MNSARCREMAEECRARAEEMNSSEARKGMLNCAAGYEKMADRVEERENKINGKETGRNL